MILRKSGNRSCLGLLFLYDAIDSLLGIAACAIRHWRLTYSFRGHFRKYLVSKEAGGRKRSQEGDQENA